MGISLQSSQSATTPRILTLPKCGWKCGCWPWGPWGKPAEAGWKGCGGIWPCGGCPGGVGWPPTTAGMPPLGTEVTPDRAGLELVTDVAIEVTELFVEAVCEAKASWCWAAWA